MTTTKIQSPLDLMDLSSFPISISLISLLTSTEKEFQKESFTQKELEPTASSKLLMMSANTLKPEYSNQLAKRLPASFVSPQLLDKREPKIQIEILEVKIFLLRLCSKVLH